MSEAEQIHALVRDRVCTGARSAPVDAHSTQQMNRVCTGARSAPVDAHSTQQAGYRRA